MTRALIGAILAILTLACDHDSPGAVSSVMSSPHETPPTEGDAVPVAAADADEHSGSAVLAAIAARLPADWSGSGVLEQRTDAPRRAPAWAKIVAEVVDDGGHRYLRTSGAVDHIKNPALARSTASARARAAMARWLGTDRLIGSRVIDIWKSRRGVVLTRMQLEVPEGWQPGMPLTPKLSAP